MARHKIVSLKRPKEPREKMAEVTPTSDSERPEYGYGTIIRLENFELDALDLELPRVGKKFRIEAEGFVESVHESESMHNKGDRSVGIQVTDLGLYDDQEDEGGETRK